MTNETYFKNRHTVRQYTTQDVDEALLERMLEAAAHAPTTGGMQLYSVVVTRDADRKRRLAPAHFGQSMVTAAPVVLTFCVDWNRFTRWCLASDAEPGFDNAQSLMSAVLDTAIFAQQFCTIAEMNGLGTCYLGTTTYNPAPIAEVLDLPERVLPLVTVTLGYPAPEDDDAPRTERLPLEAVTHSERYADYDEERVKRLYREKEQMEQNRRFVKENGKRTLAQVFTDVRYPRTVSDQFSKTLLDFCRKNMKTDF